MAMAILLLCDYCVVVPRASLGDDAPFGQILKFSSIGPRLFFSRLLLFSVSFRPSNEARNKYDQIMSWKVFPKNSRPARLTKWLTWRDEKKARVSGDMCDAKCGESEILSLVLSWEDDEDENDDDDQLHPGQGKGKEADGLVLFYYFFSAPFYCILLNRWAFACAGRVESSADDIIN